MLDEHPRSEPLVALQVDLFNARGSMPQTLAEVMARQKDIQHSSRTRMNTDACAARLNLRQSLVDLLDRLPPEMREEPGVASLCAHMKHEPVDIVHLIYRYKPYELDSKDYEFSRITVLEHWEAGARDMRNTLAHPELLRTQTQASGVTTFDLTEPGEARIRRPMRTIASGGLPSTKAR
ncbi:Patatin phospholipase [Variovorax sp. CF079]|nr:Patatin phospholipase [Variovorax sp. CF079]